MMVPPAENALLQTVLRSTLDGIVVVDEAGRVVAANQRFLRMWRIPPGPAAALTAGALLRRALRQLEDRGRHAGHARALAADPSASANMLLECRDGRAYEAFAEPHWQDGAPAGRVWSFADLTESRLADRVLREGEERYALALRGANDGFWDYRAGAETVFVSARWRGMAGLSAEDSLMPVGQVMARVHPADEPRLRATMAAHLSGPHEHVEVEYRLLHEDGSWGWVLARGAAVRDERGRVVRLAGSQTDITARKAAEAALLHNAVHDALTGLPNRTLLADRLQLALCRARDAGGRRAPRNSAHVGVLLLDLDRFQDVIHGVGRDGADALLVAVAERLQAALRPGDTVARVGDDEFVVLAEDMAEGESAVRLAERLHDVLRPAFHPGAQPVYLTASIGIAVSGDPADDAERLLNGAWTALLRAKGLGGGRHEVCDPGMQARAAARRRMEAELRGALETGGVEVHYQPVVSVGDGAIRGFEALARLRTADGALVPPAEFIPLAEETGLIGAVGLTVLRIAAERMAAWHRSYPSTPARVMSVNLSPRQFADPGLVDDVARVLAETGLAAGALRLEMTETALAGDVDAVADALGRLKRAGVSIAIDDFGTGYSSLAWLHRFPLDALKVDRSFVGRMGEGGGEEIVRTIVSLSSALGLETVAEGVETEEQRRRLQALGCTLAQGFAFSCPVPAAEAERLLADGFAGAPRVVRAFAVAAGGGAG